MKGVVFIILVLLLIPAIALAAIDYETVIEEGVSYLIGEDTLHLLAPIDVAENRTFSIYAVFYYQKLFPNESSSSYDLYRDGNVIGGKLSTFNDPEDSDITISFVNWTDIIGANSTYTLEIGEESIEFSIEARPLAITTTDLVERTVENEPLDLEEQEDLRVLLWDNDYRYSKQDLEEYIRTGTEQVNITKRKTVKTITYEDNTTRTTTTFTIQVQPQNDLELLQIIEIIPKTLVQKASALDYPEGNEPIILEEDPVVMWHIDGNEGPQTITYISDGEAKVTGNTIVLAATAVNKDAKEFQPKKYILPLILIPLLAAIIIFFARFEPKR